jgi:magnesium chelatase subunit I
VTASSGRPPDITLGELRASGYKPRSVRAEVAANVIKALRERRTLFPGLFGYDETVVPRLTNALLAGHDMILLGERGQGKSRIARLLVNFLDEWVPAVTGSEIHDDPLRPISKFARSLVEERGDATPVTWVHRSERYTEKLATPDASIADLIGEVDPIKVAEGRYLADEDVIHFGLLPRSHRGIFVINELPDLPERIQVGLFNILEERDVQIRGFKVRLPVDVIVVASANPEDYTNRGRIVTPLKDRFGAQIRTHYPLNVEIEKRIVLSEARIAAQEGLTSEQPLLHVPDFMLEIVCQISQAARRSPKVNQRSGVSVRLSIANYETMASNAIRRAIRHGEKEAVPRISDLESLIDPSLSKIELDTLEEDRSELFIQGLINSAVLEVFKKKTADTDLAPVVAEFNKGLTIHAGEDLPSEKYLDILGTVPEISRPAYRLAEGESPAQVAAAVEFLLEGLYLSRRINKSAAGARAVYLGRGAPK